MTFSETVAQQREQQEQILKRFITYSLAGSFVLHGIGLFLKVNSFWNTDQAEPEEIAIVVTEPSEEELAEIVPPEERFSEPGDLGDEASGGGSGEPGAATIVDTPSAPPSASEPSVEEPIADEPEPEPTPVAIAEDAEEPIEEEPIKEELAENSLVEPNEDIAEATEPRNLSDLLEELRRAREQTRQAATNSDDNGQLGSSSTSDSAGNGLFGGSDRGSTTAVGPGLGNGSGLGNGTGEDSGTGEGTSDRPRQGSRSREVTCSDCDFDYPEAADGAEGTAQVIVETDDQGRVVSVILSRPTGNATLDRAALEQARRRVQLNNARAGESYPIDIEFVRPNSEAARRARQRGDRRSITVSDPDPVAETSPSPTPTTATNQSPTPQPSTSTDSSTGSSTPSVTPEPSVTPTPSPSSTTNSAQPASTDSIPESIAEPEPSSPPVPEPSNSQPPAPASPPNSAPEPSSPPVPESSNLQPPAPTPAPASEAN